MSRDWCMATAVEAVAALRDGAVTPLELVRSARARIEACDAALNAVPIRCFERAEARASELMREGFPPDPPRGYLYGLPALIKDTLAVKGVRHTFGSLVYADHIAVGNDPVVDLLEQRGAIVVGKSNTPEFGTGSVTYNKVFGATLNPWDNSLTAGGSSGGAAAALASGMAWIAVGTDLGGSTRIPASFCSVVGLRPSPGVVPRLGSLPSTETHLHSVTGPMARNVADLALLLDAMSGKHDADPHSISPPEESYAASLAESPPSLHGLRAAFSSDLGGIVPCTPEVARVCLKAARWFAGQGAEVEEGTCMDLSGAGEVFQVLRAEMFAGQGDLLGRRDLIKPELAWQIEKGMAQTPEEVEEARRAQGRIARAAEEFFRRWDLLLCPTAMVPPFDAKINWLQECQGTQFDNYVDWLLPTSALSLTNCPCLSVPCGFTATGLPVGLQIVAAPGQEAVLLRVGSAFEQAHGIHRKVPVASVG